MAYAVGPKGQVVIAKELRERLGVQPGWVTVQRLAGDHVEVFFVPPEHRQSLKGSLRRYTKVSIPAGRPWGEARAVAWNIAAKEVRYRKARRP
jgi:bifunctional DNA-binding transcriptional regulator/antitoxin component of YhaV-PrlF toxin-antitoxin module